MICPVSLDNMVVPRVLPCGHTFDEKTIHSLQSHTCPICRAPFDPNKIPINWVLMEMDPSIWSSLLSYKLKSTHDELFQYNLYLVQQKIMEAASRGELSITIPLHNIRCSKQIRSIIYHRILVELRKHRFLVIDQNHMNCFGFTVKRMIIFCPC